ncbi:spore maturation protein [Crocinitomix catalasitica]|nr:spore maturation protein [Crocinitomix catalasitica]
MILNYIWIGFFLVALLVAIVRSFLGEWATVWGDIVNSTFEMAKVGFEISLFLTGILCLWMGIMKIGEKGGSVQMMSKVVGPFFNKLFPGVPREHPARGSMLMNFSANMLGLDNAATPMGLKAMNELQDLNEEKDTASNAMIMFLVLNTSGLTLIPVAVMTYRSQFGAENPADIFLPILISTYCASLVGLIVVALYQKINLLDKTVLIYLGAMTAIIVGIFYYFSGLAPDDLEKQSSFFSNVILYGIICLFIIMALSKKENIYEAFIEGAKGGFDIAIKIIPYLVAILVSIGVFRASGAMDYLILGFAWFFALFMESTEFVNGLPTALMKPLSGSGARGMMIDAFNTHGVDSFIGRLSATLQGATDTTFYIIAVYFGSVGIRKTRYAIKAGLLADLGGIVAGIIVATVFFGASDEGPPRTPTEAVSGFTDAWIATDPSEADLFLSEKFAFIDNTYDTLAANIDEMHQIIRNDSIGEVKIELLSMVCPSDAYEIQRGEELGGVIVYVKMREHLFDFWTDYGYEFVVSKGEIIRLRNMGNINH